MVRADLVADHAALFISTAGENERALRG